ncbi:MAG: NAD(P)H-binding protein [Thermoanaerobacteraceae bacterium]|nr:NAD(P)H-binding protein [Thermoanaerobacteraceae bacterium]
MLLVTGATGLVGRTLVKELLGAGLKVRCLVRDPGRAFALLGEAPEYAPGDVTDYGSVHRAASGTRGVVHLVAIIRERGERTFRQINVEGTANVVRAAEAAGAYRLIHVSVLGARGWPEYRYTHSKWEGEQIVRQSALDWTIIRPSLIYGPGFGFFDRMDQSVRLSPPPFVGYPSCRTRFQPIAARDVARCIVISLQDPRTIRRTFEIGGPEHLTYAEMLDVFLAAKKIRRIKLPVPVSLLRLTVPLLEKILSDPPVTAVELKQLEVNNTTDPDAVEKHFGFKPVRFREGIAELLRTKDQV